MKKEQKMKYKVKKERKKLEKLLKIILLVLILFLGIIYFVLTIIYEAGPFTITLDENLTKKSGMVMYEKLSDRTEKRILKSENLEFLDNISINWIPEDVHKNQGGSNNGDNYIAYSFYLENQGVDPINYWYSTIIDDVIKDVDEAVRVRIYLNDESKIYAKKNKVSGTAEQGTNMFYSEKYVQNEQRRNMQPGQVDKFTIVIWIEGDDPDCIDSLIGGSIKMHMEITEEQITDI